MSQIPIRFFIGGAVVSVFAVIGDLLKPKSFAGLSGAAPSIALATLGLTVASDGRWYAATEGRSMIAGGGCGFCRRLSRQFADDALQVEGTGRDQFVDFSLVEYGVWNLVGLRAIGLFMRIQIDASALTQTKWYEYAVRFIFGGVITPVAGLIAKKYGPVVGGLFLAFPAIFPASATLIEKHEEERKKRED